ncbi:hypothetical protein [Uliginosibacterium gangwonense]|uniref:hypothetical protein n=1 Tax=Uliginosibacterium gangwonense TaxID=392736 RepID=UPI00037607F9|nr:hypothetical protein [Uliginosibacterium gangwonense]
MARLAAIRVVYVVQLRSGLFIDWDMNCCRSLARAGRFPDWDNAHDSIRVSMPDESDFEIHRMIELDE